MGLVSNERDAVAGAINEPPVSPLLNKMLSLPEHSGSQPNLLGVINFLCLTGD
jgi:hypothetical protein